MQNLTTQTEQFLKQCRERRGLSENSLLGYQQDLRAYLNFHANNRHGAKVTQQHLLEYLQFLRIAKQHKPATVRRRMVTLRKFFNWRQNEVNEPSPFAKLDLDLRIPKRLPRPVDRETLSRLFRQSEPLVHLNPRGEANTQKGNYSRNQITGLATRVLVATGLRIGELTHLRLADVSGAGSRIRVIGKGDRERTVYVTNERLLLDLNAYWQQRLETSNTTDFLFLNSRNSRLTEPAFRKRLKTASSKLHLAEHLTPHRFRHSAATLLIEEGVDIRIVQRLLGHASIMTTELYTQVSDNSLVTAIKLADTLGKVDSR